MAVSVEGKISITIRDLDLFSDLAVLQSYIDSELKPKLGIAAEDLYGQSAGGRAGDVFHIQPVDARCVFDGNLGGFRGVDLSIIVSGSFG